MSDVRLLTVEPSDDGQRLDRWLKKYVPELPYGLAQKLIRKGAIRVDGKRCKPDSRLASGQEIRIPPVEDKPEKQKKKYVLSADDVALMKSIVIYDDGDVVAINKPAGLATQGGGDETRHVDGMCEALKSKKGLVPKLVHRLDKDTSGVMLLAREPETIRAFGKAFKNRDIRKIYWALCAPAPEQNDGLVKAPIGKVRGPIKDKMMIDGDDAKSAVTEFVIVERAHKQAAFIAFWPRTGRTHQIRVHAAEMMHSPIVGDGKYGGDPMEEMGLVKRLHLHATRLVLKHPVSGKPLDITARLPDELAASWKAMGFDIDYETDPFEQK